MNVEKVIIDAVNAQIKITLEKADYQESVNKTLRSYRQKAQIPGFRPGMAPMSLIKKMYEKGVTADELNKTLSDSLFNYIKDNNLNILGEPLPSESQEAQDLDGEGPFEFIFDIALAPELNYTLNKKDSIPYYNITVTEEMVDSQVKAYASRGGRYEKVDAFQMGDSIKGNLVEISEAEDAVKVEDALMLPSFFKNDEEKAKFEGAKVGDVITYNPHKANDGNEAELASLLRLPKEVAKDVTSDFTFEIKEINRFVEGELNQELFDQIYGEGAVDSLEAFRAKVKEDIASQFVPESDYRFMVDAEEKLVNKLKDVVFPEAFLKRWLLIADNKKTAESIDADMPKMIEELKWHLMKEDIIKKNDIKIENADVLAMAKTITKAQFAQYGMANVPEELLEQYAGEMLKKPEQARNLQDQAMSQKVAEFLKGAVKLTVKEVTTEEFNKLYEKK
ncbi:MAG: trigger factor [Bacteroidales bacterium]|nr:trigger factor [Bacteroidales bacterium]MBO5768900.1 trigger factor [Bacteroidales bacterium]MBO5818077.1 trigger factor [Bacteroidales bacterium]MBO5834996.1 trigger factor [Bacteroidales bacterium]MBO5846285.1 trigger factor [Bacteroidales bacterium]